MKAVVQRVKNANVSISDQIVGKCEIGALILVCAMQNDTVSQAEKLASKITKIRIYQDQNHKMNHSLININGSALVISQFTLAADLKRGNRPGFSEAAKPEIAKYLYNHFVSCLKQHGISTQTGKFGSEMEVSLINDGPVTICLDTDQF
jgi:D-tyrosyl-tRNA(Tyr) deacylase